MVKMHISEEHSKSRQSSHKTKKFVRINTYCIILTEDLASEELNSNLVTKKGNKMENYRPGTDAELFMSRT